jgi:hypothetical protein
MCEAVGSGPIAAATARRLLCSADIARVVVRGESEVLDVGMTQRLANRAQRRALIARSGGRCEFPGCDAPHHWCDAHHLDPFALALGTGPTDLSNLALLCFRHHHAVHEGGFTMVRAGPDLVVTRPDGATLTTRLRNRPPRHPQPQPQPQPPLPRAMGDSGATTAAGHPPGLPPPDGHRARPQPGSPQGDQRPPDATAGDPDG